MSPHHNRRAFTLVELLVVIGIIAVLIAILMPALRRARAQAQEVACASNQRQLMQAFLMFAADHKGHLPGNFTDYANRDFDKRSWLRNRDEPLQNVPQGGTIWRYVNTLDVYRCPAMPHDATNSAGSSNGRFDFVSFGVMTGAKVSNVKPQSKYRYIDGHEVFLPTPVITEEDPRSINRDNIEGLHNFSDKMAEIHRKGGIYASIDGSVHHHRRRRTDREPYDVPGQSGAYQWSQTGPRGNVINFGLGGYGITWGWWDRQ